MRLGLRMGLNSRQGGGGDLPSLDLAFALDKTLTARKGPTPAFTRSSGATYVGSDGLIHGIDTSTTSVTFGTGSKTVTLSAPLGQDQMWRVGDAVEIANSAGALMFGTVTSYTAITQVLVCDITSSTGTGTFTTWRIGYRGPRFDHDPATGDSKGLLIEESRTNFATWSEKINDASWTKTFCTADPDVTAAPNGLIVADKVVEDTTTNFHGVRKNATVTTGTAFIASIYLKAGGRDFALIFTTGPTARGRFVSIPADGTGTVLGNFNATDAVVTLQYVGNGWYRATIEVNSGTGFGAPIEVLPAISGTNANYLGDGVSGVFVWGAQVEAGAFPLSYIPTTSGTAIRGADVSSIIGDAFASFYNQSEGTIFTHAQLVSGSSTNGFWGIESSLGRNNGNVSLVSNTTLTLVRHRVQAASFSNEADFNTSIAFGSLFKSALALKTNDFANSVNGGTIQTDNSGILPNTMTSLVFGANGITAGPQLGSFILSRFTVYRKRLSNAKLQTLTTP